MKGIVTDAAGNVVEDAVVEVSDRNKDVTTTSSGEYWRILVPGTYTIKAIKDDRQSVPVEVTVSDNDEEAPRVDLQLTRTVVTTTTTTPAPEEQGLQWQDPFGLLCFKISWQGLQQCEQEE